MISIVTDNPNSSLVEFLTDVLSQIDEEKSQAVCICFKTNDRDDEFVTAYHECTYRDLQNMELNIRDINTINLIAANQERIERIRDDIDCDSEEDE